MGTQAAAGSEHPIARSYVIHWCSHCTGDQTRRLPGQCSSEGHVHPKPSAEAHRPLTAWLKSVLAAVMDKQRKVEMSGKLSGHVHTHVHVRTDTTSRGAHRAPPCTCVALPRPECPPLPPARPQLPPKRLPPSLESADCPCRVPHRTLWTDSHSHHTWAAVRTPRRSTDAGHGCLSTTSWLPGEGGRTY